MKGHRIMTLEQRLTLAIKNGDDKLAQELEKRILQKERKN